ncbi:rod shape-determining protein MreC [Geomonas sp. Red69]|uniref:Cell shape-determining protein MreC n=1 Tax=Geomonas diazotrophica TaxID=2843197 RepID=A0ABX8JLG1_9BACT|nr:MULTISPECIES: rod shape-determining protein MreC [Geomonas]MBU5636350.1 rod shape-determining protein MreC [Geomonas diazotrophica]QWV99153.1 rod shape-determining protein MreC [Geomonas nitrogeniifigens]QXE88321.1 rod shape-determining protein MreC [Geomonas nitrogeniifigens]
MKNLLIRYRRFLMTAVILLAAFLTYALNLRNREHANPLERTVMSITAPVAGSAASASGFFSDIWNNYIDLIDVRRENIELRNSVKRLNARIIADNEAVAANMRFKQLLDLKESVAVPSLAVSVIGEDSSAWFKTLVVDRGSADGLQEGMPVVATGGVVGRLVKVAPHSSRVLLLTDHASAIAAIVQRSRARGVVRGAGGGRCSLEFTVKDEDVKVGDTVISSGIGGVFPKGLPIGEVTMVKKGEYGVFQTIEVRPMVNIGKLEEALVLVKQRDE